MKIKDIQYYYGSMSKYADYIKKAIEKYNSALKKISNVVKSFGGDGYIHGCIVDISFFEHIYLDPNSGKLIPYYSPQYGKRYEYEAVEYLLKEHSPYLYEKYQKMLTEHNCNALTNLDELTEDITTVANDFSLYKPSYLIKSMQYLTEKGVIRIWNDDLIKSDKLCVSKEILQEIEKESQ